MRICLHAKNTTSQIDGLVAAALRWSREQQAPAIRLEPQAVQAKL